MLTLNPIEATTVLKLMEAADKVGLVLTDEEESLRVRLTSELAVMERNYRIAYEAWPLLGQCGNKATITSIVNKGQ
jgi:hypothetical protein